MKFSENWLRTFADPPLQTRELADALTMAGLDVEAVEPVAPQFSDVIVAEVRNVSKHPHADRLTVCDVATGAEQLQVVCGAANVRAGAKVALARIGAQLPGIAIRQAQVRGVHSAGMLCSAAELGIAPDASGLLILPADAPLGANVREYLDLDDQLITIKPTPNRGDCLSIRGVAREVCAMTSSHLKPLAWEVPVNAADRVDIVVDEKRACPRYCGRIVRAVDVQAPTPAWMIQRLTRSGVRSISAVVDITNYVMLELGQPLHAFDLAHVQGAIRVRLGRVGEKLKLLNDAEVTLTPDWLVIADDQKALALAGIMGGAESGVGAQTTDILLESAFFDPSIIAGKSRILGFGSDSSYRFERGVDFAATRSALDRATELVLEICGGRAGPICEALAPLPSRPRVRLRRSRAQRLLGIEMDNAQIRGALHKLDFEFSQEADEFSIAPPTYRFDLIEEVDMIEELARIHGYDRIAAHRPVAPARMLPAPEQAADIKSIRRRVAARDYQEIVSYSFVDRQLEIDFCANHEPITLMNPIASDMSAMRSSLIGSHVEAVKLNVNRQQERVRFFEIARCYARGHDGYREQTVLGAIAYGPAHPEQWGAPTTNVDFFDVKKDLEAVLGAPLAYKKAEHAAFHPGRCAQVSLGASPIGWIGEIAPQLTQKYVLPFAPIAFEVNLNTIEAPGVHRYRDFSRQPQVRRDLSVEVPVQTSVGVILEALKKAAPSTVSDIALFDVYRGKGIDSDKKSVAFRILLQDTRKTLGDAEIEAARNHLLQVLQEQFQAKLRQ